MQDSQPLSVTGQSFRLKHSSTVRSGSLEAQVQITAWVKEATSSCWGGKAKQHNLDENMEFGFV